MGDKMDAERAAILEVMRPILSAADGGFVCDTSPEIVVEAGKSVLALSSLPVGVPAWWPTDEMVVRGAEELHDSLRQAGVYHDFDAGLNGTAMQQEIAEAIFRAMLAASPAAPTVKAEQVQCAFCEDTGQIQGTDCGRCAPSLPAAGSAEWIEPVALSSCGPVYDAGWRDGVAEAKRLNSRAALSTQQSDGVDFGFDDRSVRVSQEADND